MPRVSSCIRTLWKRQLPSPGTFVTEKPLSLASELRREKRLPEDVFGDVEDFAAKNEDILKLKK